MDMWRSETSSLPGSGHLRPRGAGSSYLLPQTVEQGDGPHRVSVPHWAPHTTVPPVWSALTTSTSFHPGCRARLDDSGSFLCDPPPLPERPIRAPAGGPPSVLPAHQPLGNARQPPGPVPTPIGQNRRPLCEARKECVRRAVHLNDRRGARVCLGLLHPVGTTATCTRHLSLSAVARAAQAPQASCSVHAGLGADHVRGKHRAVASHGSGTGTEQEGLVGGEARHRAGVPREAQGQDLSSCRPQGAAGGPCAWQRLSPHTVSGKWSQRTLARGREVCCQPHMLEVPHLPGNSWPPQAATQKWPPHQSLHPSLAPSHPIPLGHVDPHTPCGLGDRA